MRGVLPGFRPRENRKRQLTLPMPSSTGLKFRRT
jgi:hypothetical protein